jgi:hypothetical protein
MLPRGLTNCSPPTRLQVAFYTAVGNGLGEVLPDPLPKRKDQMTAPRIHRSTSSHRRALSKPNRIWFCKPTKRGKTATAATLPLYTGFPAVFQ